MERISTYVTRGLVVFEGYFKTLVEIYDIKLGFVEKNDFLISKFIINETIILLY